MTDQTDREFTDTDIDGLFERASECFHNGYPLEPMQQALLLDVAIYLRSRAALDRGIDLRLHLTTMLAYAEGAINDGFMYSPTLPSAIAAAKHALRTPPQPDARVLVQELFALVQGECPSLLNEDSGGNGVLCLKIEQSLNVKEPYRPEARDLELIKFSCLWALTAEDEGVSYEYSQVLREFLAAQQEKRDDH